MRKKARSSFEVYHQGKKDVLRVWDDNSLSLQKALKAVQNDEFVRDIQFVNNDDIALFLSHFK